MVLSRVQKYSPLDNVSSLLPKFQTLLIVNELPIYHMLSVLGRVLPCGVAAERAIIN